MSQSTDGEGDSLYSQNSQNSQKSQNSQDVFSNLRDKYTSRVKKISENINQTKRDTFTPIRDIKCTKWDDSLTPAIDYDPKYNYKKRRCLEGPYAGRNAVWMDRCFGDPANIDDNENLFTTEQKARFERFEEPVPNGSTCSKWGNFTRHSSDPNKLVSSCLEPGDLRGKIGVFRDVCATNELSDNEKMVLKEWSLNKTERFQNIVKNPYNNLSRKMQDGEPMPFTGGVTRTKRKTKNKNKNKKRQRNSRRQKRR
jgi:hypothetical protein